jgi:uncharacterized protein
MESLMTSPYCNRREVEEEFATGSWQRVIHAEFLATLDSNSRPFPCFFGVQGLRDDQLRYTFLDSITMNLPRLGCALARFVAEARGFGPNTSLVAFTRPGPVRSLKSYREQFWFILDQLARIDPKPWPESIPRKLDDPAWEFCFAGEPIFVVCSSPAHIARQSRRSSSFMITFQPRWVFDRILRNEKAASGAVTKVRKRLLPYDMISPSPDLGSYGAATNREYKQYFLNDHNRSAICPYAELAATKDGGRMIRILEKRLPVPALPALLLNALPQQGCVELQRDLPGKAHEWHSHDSDETLIVLQGTLDFEWERGRQQCRPGDVIELPAGYRHRSVATGSGALYLIAFRRLDV